LTLEDLVSSILSGGVIVTITLYIIDNIKERDRKKKEANERLFRVCKTIKNEVDKFDTRYKSPEYQGMLTRTANLTAKYFK
jgi:hypothetical protein